MPVPSQETGLYELLGLDRTATKVQITKAYRRLAKEVHPDKPNGDAERFKRINHAHEVLTDPVKRDLYDRYGEEGLEKGGPPQPDFQDLFSRKVQKKRTTDVVHELPMTLVQLYAGQTKKMAVRRKVVDKESPINSCAACNGQGIKLQSTPLGMMSVPCSACEGSGKVFKHRQEREVLEVHVQPGAPDGHKIVFSGKADERPDAETGDVIFVVKEQKHQDFKRRGADLFVERTLSLVEALCGFEMELTQLDGRKLLVKSAPGEVVRPMQTGFDPLAPEGDKKVWETIPNADCPHISTVAEASVTDVDVLKDACEGRLKQRGLDVNAIVVDAENGKAYFKAGPRHEILADQHAARTTMYVVADPSSQSQLRAMKAVKDEGMPTCKNPFVHGNLFLILHIEFPVSLTESTQQGLRALLPPPLKASMPPSDVSDDLDQAEEHTVIELDPVQSFNDNKTNMTTGGEAYEEDEEHHVPGQAQCPTM